MLWQMIKEGKSAVSVAGSTKMYSTSENTIMHLITWLAHVFYKVLDRGIRQTFMVTVL